MHFKEVDVNQPFPNGIFVFIFIGRIKLDLRFIFYEDKNHKKSILPFFSNHAGIDSTFKLK